jgi:hypothetical protein
MTQVPGTLAVVRGPGGDAFLLLKYRAPGQAGLLERMEADTPEVSELT